MNEDLKNRASTMLKSYYNRCTKKPIDLEILSDIFNLEICESEHTLGNVPCVSLGIGPDVSASSKMKVHVNSKIMEYLSEEGRYLAKAAGIYLAIERMEATTLLPTSPKYLEALEVAAYFLHTGEQQETDETT